MRILLLAPQPFFQHRGTPIAVKAVATVLSGAGHRVDILTFSEGEDVRIPGCHIRRIPRLPGLVGIKPGFSLKKVACDLLMFGSCLRLLRRESFDLIHAVEESAFLALLLRRLFGIPFVYDMDCALAEQLIHQFPVLGGARAVLVSFERAVVRGSAGVLAVCGALEERARRWDPGALVGCAEDTTLLEKDPSEASDEDFRRDLRINGPIVMYVGNLAHYQGIDLLLESFARAASCSKDAALIVVGGSTDDIERYRREALGLDIGDRVHFVGPRPVSMLGACLRQADVLVSPRAHGVNTPMKIYSYLDSGRAVLATDLLTHTQVLDEEIAVLAPPDPVAFGQALLELLSDEGLRARLGTRARQRVREEYSPAAFRHKLVSFYSALEATLTEASLVAG